MRRTIVVAFASMLALVACGEQAQRGGGQGQEPAASCEPGSLPLKTEGRLTVGTDNPAYPPWFNGGTTKDSPWEINDPTTGEGYESAVVYGLADLLGIPDGSVDWTEVPFNQSFKPGPKDFDFFINQVSYNSKRDQAVDFTRSYYDVNQGLVAVKGTPITQATSVADLAEFKLGAPIGTTSYDYIVENIQPTQEPSIYDTQNDAVSAINAGQIDGLVVDMPTAFYMADPFVQQVKNSVIVGQFPTVGEQEYFGLVLEEGSALTECLNTALDEMEATADLDALRQTWLTEQTNVGEAPVLE
jgi:polar amino acid transport system substrate-binding protein